MLSPSDYNTAVPQFTNGNYASNPINPAYIEEPDSTNYNRGAEPLQTLPAQWWNWFGNQFTLRFNKLNVYVKNLFNELAQLLSLGNITPDGTEATPTVEQLKGFFQTCYPEIVRDSTAISNTYVPKTTTVNGHALCENISVTRADLGLGTSATVNTGTAQGCIPTVGTALGTTNGQFLATDSNGNLKPSGYSASSFRASNWTPTCVACAGLVYLDSFTASADRPVMMACPRGTTGFSDQGVSTSCPLTFNPATGVLTAKTFCGALSGNASTATSASCATSAKKIDRCGYTSAYNFDVLLTNGCTTATGTVPFVSGTCRLQFCNTTGVLTAKTFCGALSGNASTATNSTCFGGCTYAQACTNIRSGLTSCTGTVTITNKASANSATPVALCTGATSVGRSTGTTLTFNTCTGLLKIGDFGEGEICANCFIGIAQTAEQSWDLIQAGFNGSTSGVALGFANSCTLATVTSGTTCCTISRECVSERYCGASFPRYGGTVITVSRSATVCLKGCSNIRYCVYAYCSGCTIPSLSGLLTDSYQRFSAGTGLNSILGIVLFDCDTYLPPQAESRNCYVQLVGPLMFFDHM